VTGRDRAVLSVVVAGVLLVGSWLLVIQPKRSQADKLGAQVGSLQAQLASAQQLLAQGQAAKASFGRVYASLARLGEAVPADDQVPSLIYQVQAAASRSRVDFRSLQLDGSAASSSTPTGASTGASLPPGATVGPAGLPVEPFTFSFQGNFFHLSDFFNRLQRLVVASNRRVSVSGRLITLNAINLLPAPQGFPQITASVSATTYLVPAAEGLLGGATPAGPSSTPGGTSSTPPAPAAGSPATPAAVLTPPVR
jgi:Tfp pilus assembly protein PilO